MQFSVTLQSEEQIAEECRRKVGHGSSCTSYVKHQDMCLHTQKTHINVPVPLSVTPGFMTDIGNYHFCFVTSTLALLDLLARANFLLKFILMLNLPDIV